MTVFCKRLRILHIFPALACTEVEKRQAKMTDYIDRAVAGRYVHDSDILTFDEPKPEKCKFKERNVGGQ